ncbi:MAG: 1-deoxy-D-xylulose-5-phosphate reductoisomerase [candidate division Zixibacteria bacterium]|nr:1-deoxy-D-xylulose-5-phosphate reductoisomerase [candidate division Zixibacteria bacterium]
MPQRSIVLLGSTGSIGRSTLEVIKQHPGQFDVSALAAFTSVDLLVQQSLQFRPEYVCIVDPSKREALSERLKGQSIKVVAGEEALIELASLADADIIVNAVVGAAGLKASLSAVKAGKRLALANKESLVTGGPLFPTLLKKHGAAILPIDSEHSAIWQVLASGRQNELKRIVVTASGGPFRDYPLDRFSEITLEQALNHPTWKMGHKITIDSATMANKGLEVIEAVTLFQVPVEKVSVVIHPQSIVHSMVEFVDSSMIAQLSKPDMRLPITYALFWPDRVTSDFGRLDLEKLGPLTFEPPDYERFPALSLAFEVAKTGGTAPAVFNAANEVAVDAFLNKTVKFTQIPEIIQKTIDKINIVSDPNLDDILDADRKARELAVKSTGTEVC